MYVEVNNKLLSVLVGYQKTKIPKLRAINSALTPESVVYLHK